MDIVVPVRRNVKPFPTKNFIFPVFVLETPHFSFQQVYITTFLAIKKTDGSAIAAVGFFISLS